MFRRVRQFWRTLPSWITGPPRALWRLAIGTRPERHIERAFLALFVGAIALAILCAALILSGLHKPFGGDLGEGFQLVSSRTTPKELAEILRNLSFFAAGVVGALFGFFQLHNAARRTRISDDQALVAFEAERNDRFVKAAELLKDPSPAIRMAAIAAFQRLAEEDRANYRETVIRVLAGFVRAETGPLAQRSSENIDEQEAVESEDKFEAPKPRPKEAVAEAMKALSVLTSEGKDEEQRQELGYLADLRECHLGGLDQPFAQFRAYRLDLANLKGANLWGANLGDADLWGADLRGAYLSRADLGRASLGDADLRGADLPGASLRNALLDFATLSGANLESADLKGASLMDADLEDANLGGADLRGADLEAVDLEHTIGLQSAQLAKALNVTWPTHVPRPESGPYSIDSDEPEADPSD